MSIKNKKKIAIFICDVVNEYQKRLVHAIFDKAAADGYYSICYTFFTESADNYEYEKGERFLAQLPAYDDYDGIFVCFDTFQDSILCADIYQRIRSRAKCPVVSIRRECGDYNCVLIQDDDSMRSVIVHLLEEHSIKDFFYVSGPKDHPDAIKRLNCAKKVLSENGIALDEKDVFYGDFWRNSGVEIVDAILERRNGKLPEAIVCANDYMAISVCNELCARQYYVPDDVIVTGFDDTEEAKNLLPSLTSVRLDVEKMAAKSWSMLKSLINGERISGNEYITTNVVPRQSCGCQAETKYFIGQTAKNHYDQLFRVKEDSFQQAFMSMDTGRELTIEALGRIIRKYIGNNEGYRDFFIALNDFDWANVDEETMRGYTDRMFVRTAITDGEQYRDVNVEIKPEDILPTEFLSETPCGYFIVPLHYQERSYGYAAINYNKDGFAAYFLRYMVIVICNALESIRSAHKINGLVNRLSEMYVTDATTKLKNRHGFDKESVEMFARAQRERRRMAIIGIDMDGLKSINDTFGHAEGDCAIKALAEAIKFACSDGEQGYRVGGDEFQVLAMNYSEDNVRRFLDRLLAHLVEFNAGSQKPFNVRCSYGYAIVVPDAGKSLQEWMTLSDNRMYEMKESNRATRKIIR